MVVKGKHYVCYLVACDDPARFVCAYLAHTTVDKNLLLNSRQLPAS